jgi:uroporphyrin-III C-methyltransferase
LVTAHARAGEDLALDWQALADPDATVAIYMGKAAAAEVAERLMAAGLAGDTPVALVENASLPYERRCRTRLDLLAFAARTTLGSGPALLLIGHALAVNVGGDCHLPKGALIAALATGSREGINREPGENPGLPLQL